MSNVVIGIIGVILFIGLALAGATIYGSDFKTSAAESKAAQYANALAQTAHATNLFQMKTGSTPIAGQLDAQLIPRFLKTRPVVDGNSAGWRDTTNVNPGTTQATMAVITVAPASVTPFLQNVCAQFESDTGNQTTVPPTGGATWPAKTTGCVIVNATFGIDAAGSMEFYYHI